MFRGFLAVVDTAFRLFLRDKHGLFWGVAFPLMMMGLIGSVFGGSGTNLTLTTSVVVEAGDPLAEAMVDALQDVPALRVVQEDEAAAMDALRKGDRSLVVVLPNVAAAAGGMRAGGVAQSGAPGIEIGDVDPAGVPATGTEIGDVHTGSDTAPAAGAGVGGVELGIPSAAGSNTLAGGPLPVRVYYDDVNFDVAQAGIAIVSGIVDEFNRHMTQRVDVLTVDASGISAHQLSMFDFLLPGILAMVLMQTGLMGVTAVMTSYRERLLLKRVLATPFPPLAFLSGLVARFTVTNLLQGVIIVIVGVLVFGATVVGSYGNMFVLALLGSVTFLSMGFAISTMSKTPDGANTFGSAVSFPMMFLSGTFWPREFIPEALQPVIGALPLTPLVEALRGVATQGDTLAMHASGMLYLVAWAVVSLAVAARRFRWE